MEQCQSVPTGGIAIHGGGAVLVAHAADAAAVVVVVRLAAVHEQARDLVVRKDVHLVVWKEALNDEILKRALQQL